MPNPPKRRIASLLLVSLLADSTGASAPTRRIQPIASHISFFQTEALSPLSLAFPKTRMGRTPGSDEITFASEEVLSQIGADTGGDLELMNRMLRYLDRVHRLKSRKSGIDSSAIPQRLRIHDLALVFHHGNNDDKALIEKVHLDAEHLLYEVGLPRPQRTGRARIYLLDVPNNRHVQWFMRRYIDPERGVRGALHYFLNKTAGRVIIILRKYLSVRVVAHELAEIAMMKYDPYMDWTVAHNIVDAKGLARARLHVPDRPEKVDSNQEQIGANVGSDGKNITHRAIRSLLLTAA